MKPDAANRLWILRQTWSKLLFVHWPLKRAEAEIRASGISLRDTPPLLP
jgi:uncharacterized protein YqjF (DUF2071 family)